MSNEIKINLRYSVANDLHYSYFQPQNLMFDQASQGESSGILTVTTTGPGTIPVGSVTTEGFLCLLNLDGTHAATFGPGSTGGMIAFGSLKAGEPALMRVYPGVDVNVISASSTGASVNIQYLLSSD